MFSLLRRGPGRPTPHQAHEQTSGRQAALLYVRETPEWDAGHAPGAMHLPLSRLTAGAELPAAAQGRPVVTVCRSSNRSRTAAALLVARGMEATDVDVGMRAWARADLPVISDRGGSGVIA